MSQYPTQARYGVRRDESIWLSILHDGRHNQFDYEGEEWSASLIVKCVNAHDELVDALRQMVVNSETDKNQYRDCHKKALAVLAKAGAL